MKKIFSLLLAICLTALTAACGNSSTVDSSDIQNDSVSEEETESVQSSRPNTANSPIVTYDDIKSGKYDNTAVRIECILSNVSYSENGDLTFDALLEGGSDYSCIASWVLSSQYLKNYSTLSQVSDGEAFQFGIYVLDNSSVDTSCVFLSKKIQTPVASVKDSLFYGDGVVSCEYKPSILSYSKSNPTDDLPYALLFSSLEANPADVFDNGSYLYVATMKSTLGYMFDEYPLDSIKSLFDGLFQSSEFNSTVSENTDGTYEYLLDMPNSICRGKFLSASEDYFSLMVYRVLDNESPELVSALNECYDSMVFHDSVASERTNTSLFDAISAIHPDVSLSDMGDVLSVTINFPHEDYDTDTVKFFHIVSQILDADELKDTYSKIAFTLMVDGNMVCSFPIINYVSITSFSCSEPVVIIDEYKDFFAKAYSYIFKEYDISEQFNSSLEDLSDTYGL